MAELRNDISLRDRMSPVLRIIQRQLDATVRMMDRLNNITSRQSLSRTFRAAAPAITRAQRSLGNFGNRLGTLIGQSGFFQNIWNNSLQTLNRLPNTASRFISTLSHGIHIVERLGSAISNVMKGVDLAKSQAARAGMFSTGDMKGDEIYSGAYQVAQQTRSDLSETANLVNKLMLSGVFDQGDNAAQSLKMSSIINKALVAGGGTAEENKRALLQLNQALASGIMQGDELRSIREQAPYLMKILAEGLGEIDEKFEGLGIGDMKRLGSEGELTSDRIVQAFAAMSDKINEDFDKMPKTFGQGLLSIQNTWQYFLWLLSKAEGPLQKITNMVWNIADFFQSERGAQFLYEISKGITFVINLFTSLLSIAGTVFNFLLDHSEIVKAALFGIGAVFIMVAAQSALAWLSVVWPFLLVAAIIGIVVYALQQLGITIDQIVGFIIGAIGFIVALIIDVVIATIYILLSVIWLIAEIGIAVGMAIAEVILFVIQLFIWAGELIVTLINLIGTILDSAILLAKGVIVSFISDIALGFIGLGKTVLDIIYKIASAIDFVFGGDLSNVVSGFIDSLNSLEGSILELKGEEGVAASLEEIGDLWSQFSDDTVDLFTGDNNLYDAMGSVFDTGSSWMQDATGLLDSAGDFLGQFEQNPMDWFDAGNDFGKGLFEGGISMEDLLLGPEGNMEYLLDGMDNIDSIDKVGSVGKIDSDVEISDEDIKLLRDMAARDYLLQMQSVTPVANVSFGDVRETADVNRIMEVIENMVEEQLATSMVS